MDGNGVEDWLATVKLSMGCPWNVLVVLREEESIRPVPIDVSYGSPDLTFEMLYPESHDKPIGLFQIGNGVKIFEIRQIWERANLQTSVIERPVFLLNSYLLYPVDKFEISDDDKTIRLFDKTYSGFYNPSDIKQATFQWNPETHSYILIEGLNSPQEQSILSAENWVFKTNKPENAIAPLQQLLAGKIIEPVTSWYETDYVRGPERIRPYVEYLLGLAYELSGEESQAVQAYWQLWHDYPDNPYALAVRAKLELIK